MRVLKLHDLGSRPNVTVGDESEASGFLCFLILQNHAIFEKSELLEVLSEFRKLEIMRQPTHKDLPVLGISEV